MKTTKKSSSIRARVLSIAITAALIICAVLSFGFIYIPKAAFADGDTVQISDEYGKTGIRFVQVAAGEDFAIGLTYDGDLYGWSLTKETDSFDENADTLGGYYSAKPTKINVVFRYGPSASPGHDTWANTHDENNPAVSAYHSPKTGDRIVEIAATRTTAAFVTKDGYIYTWGKDRKSDNTTYENVNMADGGVSQYLLLRDYEKASTDAEWFKPYIINYDYYHNSGALTFISPVGSNDTMSNASIVAGEYNYSLLFAKNSKYYVFTWGSLMYSVPNTAPLESYNYTDTSSNGPLYGGYASRRVFDTGAAGNISVVAGGYNVGLNITSSSTNGSTSLLLRGKNFITSSGSKDDFVKTVSVVSGTSGESNIALGSDTYNGALIGAGGSIGDELSNTNGVMSYGKNDMATTRAKYYGKQAANDSSTAISYKLTSNASIKGGHRDSASLAGENAQARLYGVSLGNDFGYGIDNTNNALYVWGDNNNGQLTSFAVKTETVDDESTTAPLTNSSTPLKIMDGTAFSAVAAGKQISGAKRAFYASDTFTADGAWQNDTKNSTPFISGAVTTDGRLFVWSDVNPEMREIKYGNVAANKAVNDGDKFLAVYSGYGNNLFAITKLGKLVRITYTMQTVGEEDAQQTVFKAYEQFIYDEFNTFKLLTDNEGKVTGEEVVKVTNWTVDKTNRIDFVNADYGKAATIYVWQANKSVAETGADAAAIEGYKALVKSNEIGDVYRILKGDETNLTFLKKTTPQSYAPYYEFDGVVMDPEQQDNMFGAEIVNTNEGVGIKITPKRSSKGKVITAKFVIARYASENDFGTDKDTALYYDWEECEIRFTIADTATVKNYSEFGGGEANSNIPLLDPNNEYNKYYSLAVQDVSSGVTAMKTYFGTAVAETDFVGDINALMADGDAGFPARQKVEDGDLDYYLGGSTAAYRYYGDSYQYLFSDRDGDRVVITSPGSGILMPMSGANSSAITATIVPITISVDIANYFSGDDLQSKINGFVKNFDNTFGFYDITVGGENKTATTITFKYDVLQFNATGATGNIVYAKNGEQPAAIGSYQTNSTAPGLNATIQAKTITQYSSNYTPVNPAGDLNIPAADTLNIASVFSMPSLRIVDEGVVYIGKDDGNNKIERTYTDPVYVGSSVRIDLARDFFNGKTGSLGNKIKFSFDNKILQTAYDDFNSQFGDETGNGVKIVQLTSDSLTITPTTNKPIKLTVAIQRFTNSDEPFAGIDPTSATDRTHNEKIYVTYIFNNIVDFGFTRVGNTSTSYTITKQETIILVATDSSLNSGNFVSVSTEDSTARAALVSRIKITGLTSSEVANDPSRLFDISQSGTTSFTITPKRSGSGTVQFIASVFGKSLFFSLTVNVSKVTIIDETITVIDDKYIYVEVFENQLKQSNEFNTGIGEYKILYGDVVDNSVRDLDKKYNAIYFTEGSIDATPMTDVPPFLRNVVFEGLNASKPSIRIVSGNSSVDTNTVFYMHIIFTNAPVEKYADASEGNKLEVVIPVTSGKVLINSFSVDINCKDPKGRDNVWSVEGAGVDTKVTVRVAGLLDSLPSQVDSSTEYTVSLVSADSKVSDYFNYAPGDDRKSIVITPLYNTPAGEPCTLSVSVSYGNEHKVLMFDVNVSGILTTLPVMTDDAGTIGYGNIWIYAFVIVFGVLAIIFVIRMIVFWKKRAKQRALIKRNQELIRMRDRMHNKASIASKEQVVRTKLKMEDPKYAKMFNEMRKDKENDSGIILENSELAATADAKVNKKNKKKKGGKKTVAELKAELEAKKAAFAAAQAQSVQPVNPFANDVPMADAGGDFGAPPDGFADPAGGDFDGAQSIDGNDIIFDASDVGDGM